MMGLTGCQHDASRIRSLTVADGAAHRPSSGTRVNPIDGAEIVFVPPGEFLMGSDADEIDRIWRRFNWPDEWKQHTQGEQPAHRVRVDGFWVYRKNVTVAQYRRFCTRTGRSMPAAPAWGWVDDHPMVNVSWEDAKAYCAWARVRLPYEAEWEYAARGGNTGLGGKARTVFAWGDSYPKSRVANLADESFKKSHYYHRGFFLFDGYDDGYTHTSPVGAFPANGFGLHDMAGNVWQWCEDWSDEAYYRNSPAVNPHGPSRGKERVLRGGAFDTIPAITRISRRIRNVPGIRHDEKGFRCVWVPRDQTKTAPRACPRGRRMQARAITASRS
jgi:formylglycine-generating enzyme required for sulfatase activity